jgi:hypothetical protein
LSPGWETEGNCGERREKKYVYTRNPNEEESLGLCLRKE